jgi:transcriptional regulator with XRE-family HTH domain
MTYETDRREFEQDERISARILERMASKKLSRKQLAFDADIDLSQFGKLLNNHRPWSGASLRKIARALNCELGDLIEDENALPPWAYDENQKPVRIDSTIIDEVYLSVGNHTEPIEINPRYDHDFPEIPRDIAAVAENLATRASDAALAKGVPYYNGPAVRLISASESANYQAPDGREVKRVVLDLAPLPWHTHMLLNGFIDDPTVFAGEELKTIRSRYGDPAQVYKYGPDLSWCQLSKIFTVLMTPITTDGYGLVQLRSKTGVGFAAGLFITGVSENMHRYADEAMGEDVARRLNPLRGDARKTVDHLYRPTGVPSPLLTAMRGVSEEVSLSLGEKLEETPDRFIFLNLIFGFSHFHPFLVGVIELPFNRAETERLMQESPGKDHGEGIPYFLKLDRAAPETAKLISEKPRWYLPGLSAFISSLLFWEQRQADLAKL